MILNPIVNGGGGEVSLEWKDMPPAAQVFAPPETTYTTYNLTFDTMPKYIFIQSFEWPGEYNVTNFVSIIGENYPNEKISETNGPKTNGVVNGIVQGHAVLNENTISVSLSNSFYWKYAVTY